ncbi:outer membrane beta-barrel protein [Colwelliaceae bacterium 6441]
MFKLIIIIFFISPLALAIETPHEIGLEYSYSDINNDYSEVTANLNDLTTSHYSSSYQYEVAEHISIGIGYLKGDSSNADGLLPIDIFTDSKVNYSTIQFSAAVNYPITKRNQLYLKINVLKYDYEIIDDNKIVYNEEGNDFSYSLGWLYEFDNGIGIKAGYEVLNLGKHMDIKGFNTGISYRF